MTKKPNPMEDPPTASSSEDDEAENSSGEEEEDSSSEEEDDPKPPSAAATKPTVSSTATKPSVTATKPTASATAKNQKSDSDSGSGSETETESDSEPDEPPKKPNSGSGKSIAVAVTSTNPKKKESLPSSATLALPALKSGTKRPSEGTSRDDGNAKRPKKDTTSGDDTKKPAAFQRLWSEADEIALLNAMISFKTEKGISPTADSNQFFEYAKKLISIEVSKNQLMDKLRSLKNKYLGKEKNGKEVSFTKPHDVEAYVLVKSIWGVDGMALESAGLSKKSQTKMKKLESVKQDLFSSVSNAQNGERGDLEMSDWFEDSFLVRSIAGFGVDECTVKQGWRSAPVEAKKRIEAEMKALRVKELEYVILKAQFLSEAVSMITEVIKQRDM